MIDPNKTYRTRGGRPVRIYATDGAGYKPIHGAVREAEGWRMVGWYRNGYAVAPGHESCGDLIEVTLADELTEQIPWEVLRPEIQWVAMDDTKEWWGFQSKPESTSWAWDACVSDDDSFSLLLVKMPDVDIDQWRETLCKRPGDK